MEPDLLDIRGPVLVGRNGELYLAGGNHSVLRFATGDFRVKPESINNLRENLRERGEVAAAMGSRFIQIVAPEKYRVVCESFPISNPTSVVEQYYDGGCNDMLDPAALLRAERAGRTYFRTDTHWAPHGRVVISKIIAEAAGKAAAAVEAADAALRASLAEAGQPFLGDLGRKLDPAEGEDVLQLRLPHSLRTTENGLSHDYERPINEGRLVVSESDAATASGTLLIFGDSYLHQALSYLSFYFSRVVFCRTRFFHTEMVHMTRPDLVVGQIAERYLSYVYPDREAPPFLLMPHIMARTPSITPEGAKILASALSAGRKPSFGLFDHLAAPRLAAQ
ncbi:alginate O-acetyltransferase AlgX-related protein [Roseomonas sp. BN140053]|uniref:alginate O-acetyltransferase AlgX-related protein n=1 Tax=Roseomonas sp. BN140053 TaxID=3391898 RepID=UPI0039EA5547